MGCMMCHSIVKVKSTMGQGDFMLEYPELHELAATKNPGAALDSRLQHQAQPRAASPRLPQAFHERRRRRNSARRATRCISMCR